LKESIKATDQAVKAMADREGKYLTFTLAAEGYEIGILKLKEIIGAIRNESLKGLVIPLIAILPLMEESPFSHKNVRQQNEFIGS